MIFGVSGHRIVIPYASDTLRTDADPHIDSPRNNLFIKTGRPTYTVHLGETLDYRVGYFGPYGETVIEHCC